MDGTLRQGYSLQFCCIPPSFQGIKEANLSSQEEVDFPATEIQQLLQKQAISVVPTHDMYKGLYSTYFLVPKKTGGFRPILDLRYLNQHIAWKPFRMLTLRKLLELVQPGDWLTTIDLKDAYFHVEVARKHRKFLCFAFQGVAYEYTRLPFGYSLAPRTFSKCVDAALLTLRNQGMRVFFYFDDLIVMARSKQWAVFHTAHLILHLNNLGFAINWEKSSPYPRQEVEQTSLLQAVRKLQLRTAVTALSVMRLLGLMAAAHPVVTLALLHMRRLQRWFTSLHLNLKRHKRCMVKPPQSVQRDLRFWGFPHHLRAGVPLGRISSYVSVFTDASLTGWGGTCLARAVGGVWSPGESRHIDQLELQAVFLVLQHHKGLVQGRHVLVRTDNRTTVSYIIRQGGVRSAALLTLAEDLWTWAAAHLLSLKALHVPGSENRGADLMSRDGPPQSEWRLHPDIIQQIWSGFGTAQVDLFAIRHNTHCPLWFSILPQDSQPLAHVPWTKGLLYAFPPLHLIPPLLERVRQEGLSVILVAPSHRSAGWYAEVTQLAVMEPWPVPQVWGALSQESGAIGTLPVLGQPLQGLMEKGLSHSTIKVYAVAISSCYEGFGDRPVFTHPLVKSFLQGVRRQRPVLRVSAPQCDLPLRVSELCALSVHPSCMLLRGDHSAAVLRPNPSFVPKNIRSSFRSRTIHLDALHPPTHPGPREAYVQAGKDPPLVVRAHSTQGVAVSTALFNGDLCSQVRLRICEEGDWCLP
ncbi:uncharacterized protein LOC123979658 [Micropterus dolomieu]|uniref:uncharacterized protein LOC123979658 n=1 Tax=Micropterus dolomieu TaxID=147949 RepID=UPI001E8E6C64|nr:uncharacterized protein LOC123979658 [Micropterus dolomieu]